ncbi:hypothetical protein HanXRQr2_Chr12g0523361 [Helianthus annuus]|uniref:Uncharacterized protein n=1 Tax=Helianthus annuus TaxID=4232 RepID=A0A9K3EMW4_HELAN|nr:hypothetical protein HanXRQr2_Chr12g0523361 [Helianthus annuus]
MGKGDQHYYLAYYHNYHLKYYTKVENYVFQSPDDHLGFVFTKWE